jgi:glutathione S-transferase
MIYLHQYPAVWGLPSLSPFCIKVETFLRMANLPFEIMVENNPRKGPKGKMPVLRDDDIVIPDSSFIIQYLQSKYSVLPDDDLPDEKIALGHAVQKMVEEHLYFAVLYSRWIDPAGKQVVDKEFRRFFPKIIAGIALKWIRNNLKKQAWQQGLGRHSRDEVYELGCEDIAVLSHFLGQDNHYMLGNVPHRLDATVYAFLISILCTPFDNPLKQCLLEHNNLVDYCMRMKKQYYPE